MSAAPRRLGVVGAGTMGADIAELGCLAGMETVLHDPDAEALERGAERLRAGLERGVERGRLSDEEARAGRELLSETGSLEDLGGCELVVEAAPERVEVKRELIERLGAICGPQAILATNTSSILVSALADAAVRPESVVGMHFFNPPTRMALVEVVAAAQSSERAIAVACAAAGAMGRRPIRVRDGPGFLVNRCGRPFYAEALRLVQERVATVEQVDRICRLGGGFRMGPFELMDLVGIDVGLEVARSFDRQSFGEPRWRPNPLQERMVAAGRLGRKTGRGWYAYGDGPHRHEDPPAPRVGGGEGRLVAVEGGGAGAEALRRRAEAAGFEVREPAELGSDRPELIVEAAVPSPSAGLALLDADPTDVGLALDGPPLVVACADGSLAARGAPGACGFSLVPPLGQEGGLVELTRLPSTSDAAVAAAERFFGALGLHREWVADAPGLVLGRIVAALANEAAFALGEGVAEADDVDAGLVLGLNHPRGPIAWAELLGVEALLAAVDGLWEERREERYRAAPLLRRAAATGERLAGVAAMLAPPA